jgi:hypothetical protein
MRKSTSMAMLLTFAWSLLSPPAQASYVGIRAEREKFGTECEWESNSRKVRLESYFPVLGGNNAALVITPNEVLPNHQSVNGVVLTAFSFDVTFNANHVFKKVLPGVNIEYDDNGKEHQMLNLSWSQLNNIDNVKGVTLIQHFGHPVKVRHIAIGGHELSSDGVGALDIKVSDFKAYNPEFDKLEDRYDYDVKVVDKNSDALLTNFQCAYKK